MQSLAFLAQECPGFALRGSQVRVIQEPSIFYQEIYKRSLLAKHRIVLSSLYLGTGVKEKKLVGALRENLQNNPSLRVNVLLDYCRGSRRDKKGDSSTSLLQPLVKDYQKSFKFSLYHTPFLRGIWKTLMPQRYNETLGLQHCKVYVFDDSLIISGANLSQDYFTNRQDRYVLIEDSKEVADFYDELVSQISKFSFQVTRDGNFELHSQWHWHPYRSKYEDFSKNVRQNILSFIHCQRSKHSLTFDASRNRFSPNSASQIRDSDTWIFPTVQMGLFGIDLDNKVTRKLLESTESGSHFKFGTGYFNLTREYLDLILHKSKSTFDLLMAHPKANGFYQAKGPAGGIPHAYTLIAKQFLDLVKKNDDITRIRLFEYQKPDWTFHGKGIWVYLPKQVYPVANLIGSPNFGHRSVERDLESQVMIVSRNAQLQKDWHEEQERLFKQSDQVNDETFRASDRKVPNWVKFIVAVARHMF